MTNELFTVSDLLINASTEAALLNHDYIGSEHLLMALARMFPNDAEEYLNGHSIETLTQDVTWIIGTGEKNTRPRPTEYTPRVKKILQLIVDPDHMYIDNVIEAIRAESESIAAGMLEYGPSKAS